MIKVFIDQGHNPTNPNAGAEGNGLREQDIVYEVGRRLAILLNANPNYEARLSRNSPTEILGTSIAESLRLALMPPIHGEQIFLSVFTQMLPKFQQQAESRDTYMQYRPPLTIFPKIFSNSFH